MTVLAGQIAGRGVRVEVAEDLPVVRGDRVPALEGRLVYSDYCRGRVYALAADPGVAPRLVDTGLSVDRPAAIVAGPDGAVWVLSLEGRVSAVVQRQP